MSKIFKCFNNQTITSNLIDDITHYVGKSVKNKMELYNYIHENINNLLNNKKEIFDSEVQIKYLILLHKILPNNEFKSLFEDYKKYMFGITYRTMRLYCCELLTHLNKNDRIFGFKLHEFRMYRDGKIKFNI